MALWINAAASGFALGGSLIIAIGAQNAFILRMGLLHQHVFVLCMICALSDAALIVLGVSGLGLFIDKNPQYFKFIAVMGALFLFAYAFLAARRALHPSTMAIEDQPCLPLKNAIGICLALTFLNPHVYLDTVVLVGALASSWETGIRPYFAIGAITASFVWFFGLGYGAQFLTPLFQSKTSWRVLDGLIAVVMAWLAILLVVKFVG